MRLAPTVAALIGASTLVAMETPITGARQLGMGAAGTATTEDHTVPWWNPAALGWEAGAAGERHPEWGQLAPTAIGLEVHAGYHAYGELVENADLVLRTAQRIEELGTSGIANQADLNSFLKVAQSLNNLIDPADSLLAGANVAGSMRLGRFAVGMRWSGETAAWAADIDLRNVIPSVNGAALAADINSIGGAYDTSLETLNMAQRDEIFAALGGTSPFNAPVTANDIAAVEATYRIDDALRDLGPAAPYAADAAAWIAATATGTGTLDQNTTSVVLNSFSLIEVPISIGFPVSDNAAFGASVKLMRGRVNGTRILVFQEDVDEAVADLKGAYKDSFNVGVDLGFQAKAGNWRLGISATNLNAPTFDGPTNEDGKVRSYRLDPQVTIGIGWRPYDWFTIAGDIEQFEVGTINPEVESRRAGAGFEFAAIPWIDLRGGVYGNLADDQSPPVVTAGAGLGPEWFRIDIAAACSSELEDFGEWQLPTEMRVAVGLSSRF